jgi:hypothetical protein
MILKPLTATVTLNSNDSASILITNEDGAVVFGPLTHHALSTKHDPAESLNEHILQLKGQGMNIVHIVSTMPGIETT